jgi:glycosyltransferase involved in cell wall biosynthesis
LGNRFLGERELLDRIAAADVYVTPYGNPAQITSGTLAYALGLGKPIVSTPYVHARELLAEGRGRLIPFGDICATARAVATLLCDDRLRVEMAQAAYAHGRFMTWQCMAEQVMRRFAMILPVAPEALPRMNGRHPRMQRVASASALELASF